MNEPAFELTDRIIHNDMIIAPFSLQKGAIYEIQGAYYLDKILFDKKNPHVKFKGELKVIENPTEIEGPKRKSVGNVLLDRLKSPEAVHNFLQTTEIEPDIPLNKISGGSKIRFFNLEYNYNNFDLFWFYKTGFDPIGLLWFESYLKTRITSEKCIIIHNVIPTNVLPIFDLRKYIV